MQNLKSVDIVKWLASVIQLIGYGMTGLNMVPYKIFPILCLYIFVVRSGCHVEGQGHHGCPCWSIYFTARGVPKRLVARTYYSAIV